MVSEVVPGLTHLPPPVVAAAYLGQGQADLALTRRPSVTSPGQGGWGVTTVSSGVEGAVEGGCLPRHEGVVLVLVAGARLLRGVCVISNGSEFSQRRLLSGWTVLLCSVTVVYFRVFCQQRQQ